MDKARTPDLDTSLSISRDRDHILTKGDRLGVETRAIPHRDGSGAEGLGIGRRYEWQGIAFHERRAVHDPAPEDLGIAERHLAIELDLV